MEGLGEMSPPIFGLPFGALDNPANPGSNMDSNINRVVIFNPLVLRLAGQIISGQRGSPLKNGLRIEIFSAD